MGDASILPHSLVVEERIAINLTLAINPYDSCLISIMITIIKNLLTW